MKIRLVNLNDSADILAWKNDPITRSMSGSDEVVSQEDHDAWFPKRMEKKNWFMGEDDDGPISIVRFDEEGHDEWETSLNLNPERRGMGLAVPLLKLAVEEFVKETKPELLFTIIKNDNIAAIKSYERAGFKWRHACNDSGFGKYLWNLERE